MTDKQLKYSVIAIIIFAILATSLVLAKTKNISIEFKVQTFTPDKQDDTVKVLY